MGSVEKEVLKRNLVGKELSQILLLREKKLQDSEVLKESKFICRSSTGVAISFRGGSGGIYTLWNRGRFKLEDGITQTASFR